MSSFKPKPKLHDDILILIVEKIFFQMPEPAEADGFVIYAIDLRKKNPYTFFMAHKPITETAFITQFAKLRRVDFWQYNEQRTIEFHKDEKKTAVYNQQNAIFTGPWHVSNILLEEIVRRKKLRVTNVSTWNYLHDRDACELGTNANSLEAFCALFLGKKLDITDSMKDDYNLAIKKLEIEERPEDIKKNFEAIHAINSKELVITTSFEDDFFSVCSSLPRRQITADKTTKITIHSYAKSDKFVPTSMMSYANFVIETCPNLTMLYFGVDSPFFGAEDYYFDNLNTILCSFMNEFLKPLDKGHSELKISLTLTGTYERSKNKTISQARELLSIGPELTTENPTDIARLIKVADAKGRKHECILTLSRLYVNWESTSESDSTQASSDDDSADFDDA